MAVLILLEKFWLDFFVKIKTTIKNGIKQKAGDVQADEVKVQANDTSSFEISPNLGVEWNWPGNEVYPTDDIADDIDDMISTDTNSDERLIDSENWK